MSTAKIVPNFNFNYYYLRHLILTVLN